MNLSQEKIFREKVLEERMGELIPEAFDRLIEGVEEHDLTDSLQRIQFAKLKEEIKNLKLLYNDPSSTEFKETQKWIQYSIGQLSNDLPDHILLRFENLLTLLKIQTN